MKKRTIISLVALVVLAVGVLGFFVFRRDKKTVTIQTEKPSYGYISKTITATGTIQPVDTVTVGTQISGTIKNIYADYNSVVKKGQLIAELDKSLFQAQVDQYKANLEVAKNQFVYQAAYLKREEQLFHDSVISKQEYETALYQNNAAKGTVLSVQAQLDAAARNLSYCDIYSPISGVVMVRNVSIGQTVAASFNTPTLFIIAKDITNMQVQAAVDEADIGGVTLGKRARFTVDAFPDDVFIGTVGQIRLQPIVTANVVTYTAIIKAPNAGMKLKPGMTASIFIYTYEDSNALVIPAAALKFKPDAAAATKFKIGTDTANAAIKMRNDALEPTGNKIGNVASKPKITIGSVWVKSGDSLFQKQIYEGVTDDMQVQVLGGLAMNDEVVVSENNPVATNGTAKPAARSPFIPTRRTTTPPKRTNQPPQ